ncbi:MAG: hypothetical protein ACK47B_20035 [Armatimonadota bacterium]
MCRYAMYPYMEHYACFACRRMFRRPWREGEVPCPRCAGPMHDLGKDFKPPQHRDREQWAKVGLLFRKGVTFHSCGCGGPGPRPARLRDVEPFLMEQATAADRRERERRWIDQEIRWKQIRNRTVRHRREKAFAELIRGQRLEVSAVEA